MNQPQLPLSNAQSFTHLLPQQRYGFLSTKQQIHLAPGHGCGSDLKFCHGGTASVFHCLRPSVLEPISMIKRYYSNNAIGNHKLQRNPWKIDIEIIPWKTFPSEYLRVIAPLLRWPVLAVHPHRASINMCHSSTPTTAAQPKSASLISGASTQHGLQLM